MNLMQLFQQQYRIFGSFGCRIENIAQSLDKMAGGMKPVIDAVFPLDEFQKGWSGSRAERCSARWS